MPVSRDERTQSIDSFGPIQRKTNRFLSNNTDAWSASNVDYIEVGGIKKSLGYAQRGSDLTSTTSTSSSTSTTTTSTSTSSSTSTTTSTSTS